MNGAGHIKKESSEYDTFKKNLAIAAETIKARFPDYTIISCVDSPSWRIDYWKRSYEKSVFATATTIDNRTFCNKDGFWYMTIESSNGTFTPWMKMTNPEQKDTMRKAREHFCWTPGEFDKGHAGHIRELIGSYKGNRADSKWDYSTPKKTFKKWMTDFSIQFARVLEAGHAKVEECEADDIIAHAALNAPEGYEILIMSSDQDISRSEKKGYGQLMDHASTVATWDAEIYSPKAKAIVELNAVKKVLLGDSGDGIGPCLYRDGKRVTESHFQDYIDAPGKFLETLDKDTYTRNFELIWLRGLSPYAEEIQKALEDSFDYTESESNELELHPVQRLEAKNTGRSLRSKKWD
jgi:hypothetical protein